MKEAQRLVWGLAVIIAAGAGCGKGSTGNGDCTDEDHDGYGSGAACGLLDCNDLDPRHFADCGICRDLDGDGYGVGCDLGADCDETNGAHWNDCGKCSDADHDNHGPGCNLGSDCDDGDANNWSSCSACVDADGDGQYGGCDAYVTLQGPDCDDGDPESWSRCDTCVDGDGDGYMSGCDTYVTRLGPDCNDDDPDNWASCSLCRDYDLDGYFVECDAYINRAGPDCDDTHGGHWTDCTACTDVDRDGYGAGCNLGDDCDDLDENNWEVTACDSCADADGDGRYAGCNRYVTIPGPDCDDSDENAWSKCASCVDSDGDGYRAECDAYTSVLGPDCNDANGNAWLSCNSCQDSDRDGHWVGCDDYTWAPGPDCNDQDPGNWSACATCVDADGDNYYFGCDSYLTVAGPDCNEGDPQHWLDCGACADSDGDGRGSSCDLGPDCDETSATAKLHWADCGLCIDGDSDGYGPNCDLGPDCNDGDGTINPGEPDTTLDGTDQNCDGFDGISLADGFELGRLNPKVWESASFGYTVVTNYVDAGSYALDLARGGVATSLALDTSACSNLTWSFDVQRGPPLPDYGDYLLLEYFDGATWQWVADISGSDYVYNHFEGILTAATAFGPTFRMRLRNASYYNSYPDFDDFFVDNFFFGCAGDIDGDGAPDPFDCAPLDPREWIDCASPCTDADGDLHGSGCDTGPDCNDDPMSTNAAYMWTASACSLCGDGDFDGHLFNCDAYPAGEVADCDDGDENNWISCATCSDDDGDGYLAGCDAYVSLSGPDCAPTDPNHWNDCGTCSGCTTCVDPDGDNYGAGCDLGSDCDEVSAMASYHWADCNNPCTDGDIDGYGNLCDAGDDCNDGDPAINPGASDATVDGVDQNCDVIDGPLPVADDFETGTQNTAVWAQLSGWAYSPTFAYRSAYSLYSTSPIGVATTVPFDASACSTSVSWSFWLKRGPEAPDPGHYLYLEYFNGSSWIVAATWQGNSLTDTNFSQQSGTISSVLIPGFAMRLRRSGGSTGLDVFYVDDFAFGCTGDGDGDGTQNVGDCAMTDPYHWLDCGVCVDGDSDNYGANCDLGPDCNDGDGAINPSATDDTIDGVDQNCDGFDGPVSTVSYGNTPFLTITDNGGSAATCNAAGAVSDAIAVSEMGTLADVNVAVNITHGNSGDLDLWLFYDNGSGGTACIELSTDNGSGADYAGTLFDDEAAPSILSGSSPFSGSYVPEGALSGVDGLSLPGTFTLYVNDDISGITGTLDSWGLDIVYR